LFEVDEVIVVKRMKREEIKIARNKIKDEEIGRIGSKED
jgi:hypothetical protein